MPNTYVRTFTSTGTNSVREPITINSTVISFIRISAEGASPLISMLLINPITRAFNRSRVKCTEILLGTSLTTVVHVMDSDYHSYHSKCGYACMHETD